MEFNTKNIVLLSTVITTALIAGFFYGWIISVIPGTKKIPDQAYIETMQSINREIINARFLIVFFGALIFLVSSAFLHFKLDINTTFYLIITATILYAVGTIGVTIFGNVPLNNTLEAYDLSAFDQEDFRSARHAFEEKWNMFNRVRTVASIVSFILVILAFCRH